METHHVLFQITNLMHNSFILQQYVCYVTILNMFRAAPCSSSGGQIVLLQPLVSSLSVNSYTVCRLRADCSLLSTCILYSCLQRVTIREAVVIQFVLLRISCSKHVADRNVTYILLKKKGIVHYIGNLKKSIL